MESLLRPSATVNAQLSLASSRYGAPVAQQQSVRGLPRLKLRALAKLDQESKRQGCCQFGGDDMEISGVRQANVLRRRAPDGRGNVAVAAAAGNEAGSTADVTPSRGVLSMVCFLFEIVGDNVRDLARSSMIGG